MGNFNPSRGRTASPSETLSLRTKIHIYKGKIKSNGNPFLLPLADGPKVFSVVNSDDEGRFQVQLPPGEYTLFIELEDGKLYRNSFDGKGNFSTVKLIDGESSISRQLKSNALKTNKTLNPSAERRITLITLLTLKTLITFKTFIT